MGVRYPDQVGEHMPCVPGFGIELMSPFGTVLFCHDGGRFATTVAVGVFGRHRATQDLAQWGVRVAGRVSWH